MTKADNIKVICRFRPMNEMEKTNSEEMLLDFTSETSLSINYEHNSNSFIFDHIFPQTSKQSEIYNFAAKDVIKSVLDGYNGTILAYGQTGSGKTYTMEGKINDDDKKGIIPRMIKQIFDHIYKNNNQISFIIKVSMLEIYQEKIKDLINTSKTDLEIREDRDSVYIENISEYFVNEPNDILKLIQKGSSNRAQAAHNMNEHSSRSHSIFILTINQMNKEGAQKEGKLFLVDLAGSEKINKTGASGVTLEEAKKINLSLTALGKVINSLTDKNRKHIPYKDSKLTRVLKESLGGNSKTCLIITCSPSGYNYNETISTLRFGERAKKIKNIPKINKEVSVAELQQEILKLKNDLENANKRIKQLEKFIKENGLNVPDGDYQIIEEKKNKQNKQNNKIEPIKEEENENEEINSEINNKKGHLTERKENPPQIIKDNKDNSEKRIKINTITWGKYINADSSKKSEHNFTEPNNNNILINNNNGEYENSFFSKIKKFKEIQQNPDIMTFINNFQSQMKNFGKLKKNNYFNNEDRNFENKKIQTEKFEDEHSKVVEDFKKQVRVLNTQIEDYEASVENSKKVISDLEEKNEKLNEKLNEISNGKFQQKLKKIEKKWKLKNNLIDLKKKLEESQFQRNKCENQKCILDKSIKEKNDYINELKNEISELKEKISNKGISQF